MASSTTSPPHSNNNNDITFGHEDLLPPLPLPTLDGTCKKLLRSLTPLCPTQKEYNNVAKKIADFKNGIGQKLQNILAVEAATTKNWLERHWDDAAYLNARYPCAVNTNWGVGLMGCGNNDLKSSNDMYVSAACCAAAITKFYVLTVLEGSLPPEGNRGKPYSMFQNKRTFGVNQIPGHTTDRHTFSKDMKHIMVLSNNIWYKVIVLNDMNHVIDGVTLARQLYAIHNDSKKYDILPYQILTSQNRDVWAGQRYELIQSSDKNATLVGLIESALFCITLTHETPTPSKGSPTEEDAIAKAGLCSPNCGQTWFDHGYNIIAFPNGSTCLQGNHSPADAMTALYMIRWLQESIRNNSIETVDTIEEGLNNNNNNNNNGNGRRYNADILEDSSRYIFDTNSWPNANVAIRNASIHAKDLFNSINVRVVTFDTYGSDQAKVIKMSPDALVQMGLLLAYYRLHDGEMPATYETAHSRQFYHGRTETIRSCSIEVKKMCEAMVNANIDSAEKEKAIRVAIAAHNKYTIECMNGRGIDRHLLVLQLIANEIGLDESMMPSLFSDPLYIKSKSFDLSTSNISGGGFDAPRNEWWGGYAPATTDGYGCGYTLSPKCVKILLTTFRGSNKSSGEKFEKAFKSSMIDLYNTVIQNQTGGSKL